MKVAKIVLVIGKHCHSDKLVCSECNAVLCRQTKDNGYRLDFNIDTCPSCGRKLVRG